METLSKKYILETIDASEEYSALLDTLLDKTEVAENQVVKSAQCASRDVETLFDELANNLISTLTARKTALLDLINKFRKDSLVPLEQCKQEIITKKTLSSSLLADAKNVLKSGGFKSDEMYTDFMKKSSLLGSLPALPDLELVPFITFKGSPELIVSEFRSCINCLGNVFKIGPVQIADFEPRPGSLLIRWEEIDSDTSVEIQGFRLQMALYDSFRLMENDESIFRDVYIGSETSFLVRSIRQKEMYCFRVCCRVSAESGWSAWSQVKASSTDVTPFTWDTKNSHYLISNDDKLARMVVPGRALFSADSQISHGHSVHFTFLNSDQVSEKDGVALSVSNTPEDQSLIQNGTLFVSCLGSVFIDGKKKMINLPVVENNGAIVFSCEIVKHKWRITIESGSKAVTYDWETGTEHLFFAAVLCQSKTQVLVE